MTDLSLPPPPGDSDAPATPKGKEFSSDGPQKAKGKKTAYHFTDLGNAKRLVARWGRDMRYCHVWGRWLIWDGTRWQQDETGAAQRLARETVHDMLMQAKAEPDASKADPLRKWALMSESANRLVAMVKLAQDEPGSPVSVAEIDANPMLLNLKNGTLDLRTGTLKPHNRTDLCSKIAPVAFKGLDAPCPRWDKFLWRIQSGSQDNIDFISRAIGLALTGDSRRRILTILYGSQGRNGKSTFLDTIHAMMGDYAISTPAETLMVKRHEGAPTNDIARLRGARFVSASETEEGRRLSESLVKQMTGGDMMTARFLNQEFFDFKPEFKVFLATNHKPSIRNSDDALWDRLALVPFEVRIPDDEVDAKLPEKLHAEMPGILAWAMRGCLDWQKNGLRIPEGIKAATAEYRAETDILGLFLEDCCVNLADNDNGTKPRTAASAIYHAYEAWCQDRGEFCIAQTAFGRKLGDRGYASVKIGGVGYREGIGLQETRDG